MGRKLLHRRITVEAGSCDDLREECMAKQLKNVLNSLSGIAGALRRCRLRADMRTELKRLHARLGVTTLYVTHDQLEAVALADRVAVLNQGDSVC